ncbi:MAG TPA: hypothetical protein VI485_31330 [Vicinamibacterales bacterium]|nr:hypothetical protein [Vicinamibacterales bacterium]
MILQAVKVTRDGREDVVRGVRLGSVPPAAFRDLLDASRERTLYNVRTTNTDAVSVIVPNLIFEELEIQQTREIMMVEKLLTDRTGEKGARDLLVVAGLLAVADPADLDEMVSTVGGLPAECRHTVRSSLTLLSLVEPVSGMPDPSLFRAQVTRLLARIEGPVLDG